MKVKNNSDIIPFYGITKDPKTNDFMMVLLYAHKGSLRQNLNKNFNSLSWEDKFFIIYYIASGLSNIHEKGLTHQDFHSGNILSISSYNDANTVLQI